MKPKEIHAWRWRSFEKLLQYVCQQRHPKTVLEWGPGHSTHTVLNYALSANILSIEHHPTWFQRAKAQFQGCERVELVNREVSLHGGKSQGYSGYPLYRAFQDGGQLERYDLVFVDGRNRFDCLMVARVLAKPNGIVMVHDCARDIYKPAIESYPYYRYFDDVRTAVMSKSPIGFLDSFEQGPVPTLDDGW